MPVNMKYKVVNLKSSQQCPQPLAAKATRLNLTSPLCSSFQAELFIFLFLSFIYLSSLKKAAWQYDVEICLISFFFWSLLQ